MKTKFLFMFLFTCMVITKTTTAQKVENKKADTDPIELLGRTIPHGIPVEVTQDLRNFLTTLYDNENLCNGFVDYIRNAARKDNIIVTGVYRGNMIDFKVKFDSLEFSYHLWLDPTLDEGALNVVYKYKGRSLLLDEWIYPRFTPGKPREVILSALDSKKDFDYHAEIVALMMKAGIYIPGPLSARTSYNLKYSKENVATFRKLLKAKDLNVVEDNKGNMLASNGFRAYQIITLGEPEVTFEVTPKW